MFYFAKARLHGPAMVELERLASSIKSIWPKQNLGMKSLLIGRPSTGKLLERQTRYVHEYDSPWTREG